MWFIADMAGEHLLTQTGRFRVTQLVVAGDWTDNLWSFSTIDEAKALQNASEFFLRPVKLEWGDECVM